MDQRLQGQVEYRLAQLVRDLDRKGWEWLAVHLHLSRLRPYNRRPYHLRIAESEFDPLIARHPGELFLLGNGDIVFLVKGAERAAIAAVVDRLRYLFADDPFFQDSQASAGDPRFCSWYDLETDYTGLADTVEDLLDELERRRPSGPQAAEAPLQPLDAATLAEIERKLETMDLSDHLRVQPICAMLSGQKPEPVFSELYVSIGDLAKAVAPGVDLAENRWLFQRFTETLDGRLLLALGRSGDIEGPVSINLNVRSVLSRDFAEFDRAVKQGADIKVLVEIQLVDIFADLGAYVFARDYLRERDYLICIDGLHHLHLPLISRRNLGADLVKVQWTADLADRGQDRHVEALEAAIRRAGTDRTILCRCDGADAIRFGQSVGVRLFQGRFIDSRLRGARPVAVQRAREALRAAAS
jgi:hypothetical protein